MRSATRVAAVLALASGPACQEEVSDMTPEQHTESWLDGVRTRAPIELVLSERSSSGQCDVPTYPSADRGWSEVSEVIRSDASLEPVPAWVFGPISQVPNGENPPLLYAAAPWGGEAAISCGGEPAAAGLVLVWAAEPIERLGVLDRDGLWSRMAANVEAHGLEPVVDEDFSRRICPDTAGGCG
jgi:hypothetical protein